jgi:hypothetical protein
VTRVFRTGSLTEFNGRKEAVGKTTGSRRREERFDQNLGPKSGLAVLGSVRCSLLKQRIVDRGKPKPLFTGVTLRVADQDLRFRTMR